MYSGVNQPHCDLGGNHRYNLCMYILTPIRQHFCTLLVRIIQSTRLIQGRAYVLNRAHFFINNNPFSTARAITKQFERWFKRRRTIYMTIGRFDTKGYTARGYYPFNSVLSRRVQLVNSDDDDDDALNGEELTKADIYVRTRALDDASYQSSADDNR